MSDDLTPDEPYEPEDEEVKKLTGNRSLRPTQGRMEEAAVWRQPKVHEGGTQLARDLAFEKRLAEIEAKMDAGTPLSEADADYAMNRATLRLFRSKRPSMVAKAVSLMQNGRVKKILDTGGGRVPEKPDDHGLALPGGPG